MLKIFVHKESDNAVVPEIAYNGTSAAFDITCTETTTIEPGKSAVVPNNLNLTIDQTEPYYMQVALRSSMGFKKELVCHPGIIDAGYTGPLGVKIYNLGAEPVTIKEGERYAQITVHQKIPFDFFVLNDEEFKELESNQQRGAKGFGSSNCGCGNCDCK